MHLWTRDVAPLPEIRKWHVHDDSILDGLSRRHWAELEGDEVNVQKLLGMVSKWDITSILAAEVPEQSSADVLRDRIRTYTGPQNLGTDSIGRSLSELVLHHRSAPRVKEKLF
ncbi:MAG: DUF488 family protein [Euryarchaeota archaeon]|nr:DUF488 family protein [Euryarchaeota archaeon]